MPPFNSQATPMLPPGQYPPADPRDQITQALLDQQFPPPRNPPLPQMPPPGGGMPPPGGAPPPPGGMPPGAPPPGGMPPPQGGLVPPPMGMPPSAIPGQIATPTPPMTPPRPY